MSDVSAAASETMRSVHASGINLGSRTASTSFERPVPFGDRYELMGRLATGGMAEIYLARQAAMAGFEKEVVIKRLKSELAVDPRIVDMFLDEARIGALLGHPNIVHVYDVDEHDGLPYIAMEYIQGEELNQLCRRSSNVGNFLPLEHAVELIRQAASGMGYFHAKREPQSLLSADGIARPEGVDLYPGGQPLDIVHCDISPSNLLVTEDGFLKIIDFGIARARGQRFRSEGVIPGKLSYMSPDQAERKRVDHRSDIFSLGVVLYEITVGKRLFRGTPQDVVARLTEGTIEPPTFAKHDFPPALEAIVMRALERHPDNRYQSAYDLADDLEAFQRDAHLSSGPVRIARYLDDLSHAHGGMRRPELVAEANRRAGSGNEELNFDGPSMASLHDADSEFSADSIDVDVEWDDVEEPEQDVAEALGLELEELRALRTPVPQFAAPTEVVPATHIAAPAETTPAAKVDAPLSAKSATPPLAIAKPAAGAPWLLVAALVLIVLGLSIKLLMR